MKAFSPVEHKKYPGWFVIPRVEGYLINREGYMLRLRDRFVTKGSFDGRYYKVSFYDPKAFAPKEYMHRLVAQTFLGEPTSQEMIVNHKDGDNKNNYYLNLEYISISENLKHAYDLGLKKPTRKLSTECYYLNW